MVDLYSSKANLRTLTILLVIIAGFVAACTTTQIPEEPQLATSAVPVSPTQSSLQTDVTASNMAESLPTETLPPVTPTLVDRATLDCDTETLIFGAVHSLKNGVHVLYLDNDQVVTLVEEGSETIEDGWRLTDFDVSFTGQKVVFAVGQGSSMQGLGRIYSIDLLTLDITLLHEESSLITEVVFSPGEDVIGFIVSKPGYYDLNLLFPGTATTQNIVSGEEVAGGLPMDLRNVEWSPDGRYLAYQISQQINAGDPTQSYRAFVATVACVQENAHCVLEQPVQLDWISSGAHYLSWTSDSSIIDASLRHIEIRDIDGTILENLSFEESLEVDDVILWPASMSPNTYTLAFTYGIENIWLFEVQEDALLNPLLATEFAEASVGKAEFCRCIHC